MPTSVATHASLLLKAAAAKPCFSARAAARIPAPSHRPRPPAGRRLPTTVAALAAAARRFRWPSAAASARGLCAAPHFGGEGMGSDAGAGGRKRRVPAVNGLAKDAPAVNGMRKEEPVAAPPRLLTLPTVLTIGRVAAVPLLISTFYMEGPWAAMATTGIFLAAAVTDWLDGYIARKMQLGTPFGAFLDPVADKLMVAATLVLLCTKPLESSLLNDGPWLLTVPSIAIIGREITMSAVREWAASQNSKVLEAVAVNNLGKWKTATQMTALTLLLASRDPSLPAQGALVAPGVALLYVSTGLAVWSLVVYMRKIWRILLK
ncbi:Cardiolipin synthase (CMP-forming), mitochondrial [Zea mays]|uniref:CDP-diacylglycerol--glycerol-3-phosphate 3-phosphatidyltransferase n=3 Tax=Zea mays TaxID=4577 RepID=A0A1D6JYP0_MAIZE|nr:Cardiolipin synthase (CMP-forming), mitochondrial [Zea mays]ONL96763.1 CDP-diacylglycerol--glycerol-3-phosphate 3-phosphatidyltransferase [Zea mays]ONL96764.1 CDP-diacylglycerol--glycerol-3-phosphate 3-phosphatidyltransferase [Zea mays]